MTTRRSWWHVEASRHAAIQVLRKRRRTQRAARLDALDAQVRGVARALDDVRHQLAALPAPGPTPAGVPLPDPWAFEVEAVDAPWPAEGGQS